VAALASGRRSGSDGPRAGRAGAGRLGGWAAACGAAADRAEKMRGHRWTSENWAENGYGLKKVRKKGNSFSFSENIFAKKNNLEIAR
jgi:hypothetical protein